METGSTLNSGSSQASSNILIAVISSLFILVLLYPWIIAVSVLCFVAGFAGLEHIDKFVKTAICAGRFGDIVKARYKDYVDITGDFESEPHVKTKVTADPLQKFVLEDEQKKCDLEHEQEHEKEELDRENVILQKANPTASLQLANPVPFGNSGIHNTLIIPARISTSNRSSPEKTKPSVIDSPKRSLSAASSRRVSEDIPGSAHGVIQPFAVVGGVSGIYSNKSPSPSRSSTGASTPSPSITLNPEIVGALRVDQEFRVNVRVDKAFGRMFTNIIDYYISPSWAPYETRRQLKLNLKQLLNSVAERCSKKLLYHKKTEDDPVNLNAPIVTLIREKLLPLALHYVDKMLSRGIVSESDPPPPIVSDESKRRLVLKIRLFCRKIFQRFLIKDDKKCKLWMELCVAVLADGVLVNVMSLGRDKLPELLEDIVTRFKKSATRANEPTSSPRHGQRPPSQIGSAKDENEFVDPLSEDFVEAVEEQPLEDAKSSQKYCGQNTQTPSPPPDSSEAEMCAKPSKDDKPPEKVPFLLDSFLDSVQFNLEKPDPIVSRWRPTLKDIVSETDLLYPLIQYMKHVGGQQSLAYLQGVLDEFPQEGDPYCRRVLELEYLPGFCRSSLFLETMGLSRVEVAMEVGADPYSIMRRNSNAGHTRSASYGGPSTSSFREFLKIEQGIVDGLPLSENSQQNVSISSASSDQSAGTGSTTGSASGSTATLPVAGEIQPNLAFKRRPHLEMYIAKFIKSTSKSWKQYYDPLAEQYDLAKRVGTDAKSYDEWNHPDVTSRVRIESSTSEIYNSLIDLVTALMRSSPTASPFCSGLAYFLKPYLMPVFNEQLDQNLTQILSENLLVTVVDLIADVYEETNDDGEESKPDAGPSELNGANRRDNEYGSGSPPSSLAPNLNASEEECREYHNSSCTTCDPSFKSTIESFLTYILEFFIVKFIDLDYFVKCFSRNREYIFLFFVDLLDVLVAEIVEE